MGKVKRPDRRTAYGEDVTERVLVYALPEDDAVHVPIVEAGFAVTMCTSARALCTAMAEGAGVVVITQDVYSLEVADTLRACLSAQPPWSDLPLLMLLSAGHPLEREAGVDELGARRNVTFLERPLRPFTLVASVRSLLRARRHQYEVRDLVRELESFTRSLEARVECRTAALRESNARLQQEVAERERLQQVNMEISTQERQRFAQDLHDGLCQQLSSLSFMTAVLKEKLQDTGSDVRDRVDRIDRITDAAIRETRALAHSLFPAALEEKDLSEALRDLAGMLASAHRIECEVRVDGDGAIDQLAVATNLYRIAQEALSNAIRHGQASRVTITLAYQDGRVDLRVRDDGVGIDAKPQSEDGKGIGMKTMHRRAEAIGAHLEVGPAPKGGTVVWCRLPYGSRTKGLAAVAYENVPA